MKILIEQISPNIVCNTTGIGNSGNFGAINLQDSIVVIDSGRSFEIASKFRKEVEKYFSKPVKYLFLTHTHSDHRNGMKAYKDVKIVMSTKSVNNMPVSVKIKEYQIIEFEKEYVIEHTDQKVVLYHIGGHTSGSSCLYDQHEKTLFSGDILFLGNVNYNIPFMGFYQNKPKSTGNPDESIEALEFFSKLEINTLIPGHGSWQKNPKNTIKSQLNFLKALKKHFLDQIKKNVPLSSYELPEIDLIRQAYDRIKTYPKKDQQKERKWLENYLNWLKKSFYNYYDSSDE